MFSTDRKVFLVSRRWPHHAGHSGYDRLGSYIGQVLTAKSVPNTFVPDRFLRRIGRKMPGYDSTSLALEIKAAMHMAGHRDCLYHVLYGDNCFNYLGLLNGWRGHQVIASYHHPPQKLAMWVPQPERLRRLSAAIILGSNQHSFFGEILPRERVFLVPYAVDTSYFTPPEHFFERENNLCLFVGAHLRDFPTLRSVINNARILAPQLKFAVVLHPMHLNRLNGVVGNFTVYNSIPEHELLRLYRSATLLIQPLKDAVANTAVLEAMSCGLPIVLTDVGAVRDYVDANIGAFVPPFDPDAVLETILHLIRSPGKRNELSLNARNRALQFDWNVITKRMHEIYARLA
jgi:glycosyltransferase involved in cell wall biosynthesis